MAVRCERPGRAVLCSVVFILLFWGLDLKTHRTTKVRAQASVPPDAEVVYLTEDGRLAVWDPYRVHAVEIQWNSGNDKGFHGFTVGDFNGDGDYEIAGIRGEQAQGEVVVYDPVVNSTTLVADGAIYNVPWKRLATFKLSGTPTLIAAGNLDASSANHEIICVYQKSATQSAVRAFRSADGNTWNDLVVETVFDRVWDELSVGDIDEGQADEIVLVDADRTNQSVVYAFKADRIYRKEEFARKRNGDAEWLGAMVGQVYAGGHAEVVAFRKNQGAGGKNAFVFKFHDGEDDKDKMLEEEAADALYYNPNARYSFFADINGEQDGESDQEVFFLRVTDNKNTMRLFMVNRGGDEGDLKDSDFEHELDESGWKSGAGGEIDGDGKDEVIIRNSKVIRVFLDPDGDADESMDEERAGSAHWIRAVDVDRNGYRSADKPNTPGGDNPTNDPNAVLEEKVIGGGGCR